jgi:zinc protease
MTVDFGSAAETEDEQGLAHFIEHMAFNGTTNVPEGEMVKNARTVGGLSFGADTNASTGYTQTQYKLDLPRADPALLETIPVFDAGNSKRDSLQRKARSMPNVGSSLRKSANVKISASRVRGAANNLFYPNTYFATRYPIGQQNILESAPAERMRALYRKWYRPDRVKIIVVGPVDVSTVEQEIVRKFANWSNQGSDLQDFDTCTVDTNRNAAADMFVHPKISEGISVPAIFPGSRSVPIRSSGLWSN